MKQRGPWLLAFLLAACGPKAEPAAPVPAAPAPTASSEPTPPPAASEPPAAAEPAPSSSAAVVAPSGPSIHELCFGMCDRLKEKCPKSSWESCRLNCGKYDPPADGCEDVVRSALTCAKDAADLVCANVAPESCSKQFRQIGACASGQKPSEASAPSTSALPAGFVLWTSAAEGLSAPLPEGHTAGSEPAVLVTAKYKNGPVYAIRKLPRPAGKLNEKVFLKVAMDLFGRCTDKMKMQGMVDKPGRTSIGYSMRCPDGASERGVFWATDKALFVASARGASFEELGPTDAFLYGFEAK